MERADTTSKNFSPLTVDFLKGKQSVRATFRIPSNVIHLLSVAANQLGIKQKSLFDQLVEDKGVLQYLAQNAKNYRTNNKKILQKTYVLSRSSLELLDDVAEQNNLSRDILVEMSINRLKPVISAEQKKQKIRKSLMKDVHSFFSSGKQIATKTIKLLDPDDPFKEIMTSMMDTCEKKVIDLEKLVKRMQLADIKQEMVLGEDKDKKIRER